MSRGEFVGPPPSQWDRVVEEVLGSQEYEPGSFDVFPIIGKASAGKNSIQAILEEKLISQGFKINRSSAGDQIRQHQKETTGRRMRGHFTRPLEFDGRLDLETAKNLINPSHKGQILLPEGRLLGFISAKLKGISSRKGLVLPGNIHPILIEASDAVRYQREYDAIHADDPTVTFEEAKEYTRDQERGEQIVFTTLYPELALIDWYSPNYKDETGKPVYELHVDTSGNSAAFSARKILDFITSTATVAKQLQIQK
jgi:hypothetical protein